MESATGQQNPPIIDALLKAPRSYSFVQAVRLMALHLSHAYGSHEAFLKHGLKVIPELTLGHPSTDIAALVPLPPREQDNAHNSPHNSLSAETKQDKDAPAKNAYHPLYELTATFLALYGTSSPLPTFYTEELIEEARLDYSASRDFLNIFNQALYQLYYRAFNHYKLPLRTLEQHDAQSLHMQYCFLGFGGEELRRDAHVNMADLRYIGFFAKQQRSAYSLQRALMLHTGLRRIHIEECVQRKLPIPREQRCTLGSAAATLGDAVIGLRVHDIEGKFFIHLYDLDAAAITSYGAKGKKRQSLIYFLRQFLFDPLEYDLVLHAHEQTQNAGMCLGCASNKGLGNGTFLNNPHAPLPRVTHYLSRY